jgi:1,4-alpha-glucan branching enzyme
MGDEVEVTFILDESSHTCPVSVAGDFNDWDVTAHRLVPDGHGAINTTVVLEAGGRFEFRYRDASGRWFNDEAADDYSENAWGGMNGVLLS